MRDYSDLQLTEHSWPEIRDRVHAVNPEFATVLDEVNPDKSYTVFLARYPYGSQILRFGKLFLPGVNSTLIGLEDPRIPTHVREQVGYVMGTNPMTMVLKNSLDLYIALQDRNVLYSLIPAGSVFGIWYMLDNILEGRFFPTPVPLWDMTAGARSLFLLPKITDVTAFQKLQKQYDIKADAPKELADHWQILKEIARHPSFTTPWEVEVIYFSKKWSESINDPAWSNVQRYLTLRAWRGTEFWRNQFSWDLTFSRIQAERNIKPCPQVADIAYHLLAMSVGAVPGFRPLLDNTAAPVSEFMQIFESIYGSRYAPLIMGPGYFSVFEPQTHPIYYSSHYPTAIKLSPKSSSRSSMMTDLYNVRSLMNKYLQSIQQGDLKIAGTVLYEAAKRVKFTFCHYVADEETKMVPVNAVIQQDLAFQQALRQCKTKDLPKTAPFLNGCVQISHLPPS